MRKKIAECLKAHDHFLLTSHVNPEGDAVCSTAALALLLTQMGKHASIVAQDPLPRDLTFLDVPWLVHSTCVIPTYEWGIVVDSPLLERVGTVASLLPDASRIIAIDHHISHKEFAALTWVDAQASSCGEMIYDLYKECGVPISVKAAELLFISISTDTGSFKYSNTSPRTHRIVAELMETGMNAALLNERLYASMPLSKVRVMQLVLNSMNFTRNNTVGYTVLKNKDLKDIGATHQDMEGVIDAIRVIETVEIAFVMTEGKEPGTVKASFRAKGAHDVNAIARVFGGGGHIKAAGCTIKGTIEEALPRVLTAIEETL